MQSLKRLWCKLVGHQYELIIFGDVELELECKRCGYRVTRLSQKRQKKEKERE